MKDRCKLIVKLYLLLGLLLVSVVGCGKPSGKMVHDEGANYYIEAMKVRATDEAKCLELLGKSIEKTPTGSAYFHRAWILAKQDSFDEASKNIVTGLELTPEESDLLWLQKELGKPEGKRSFKYPPSSAK